MENGAAAFAEEPTVGGVPCFTWTILDYVPKSKKKRHFIYQIQMITFTYVIFSLFNMARRPFSVVKGKILERYNLTLEKENATLYALLPTNKGEGEEFLGLMDFLFVLSYGVCQLASGMVADCYNPRYYLTAGCFLSGYFCALLGLIQFWEIYSFRYLATVLILLGASQSTSWPVVLSSCTHWYGVTGKRRGMFFGFWNTHNYLGSSVGILLAGSFVDGRWMWSFYVPGIILVIAGVVVFLYMVVDPKDLKELDRMTSDSSESHSRLASKKQVPSWLDSKSSLTMYEALMLPGVIEYSACMFFSRMVGYIFLFWLPVFMQAKNDSGASASRASYYPLAYVIGGSIGGIFAGIIVDISKRSALTCVFFLLISIPILFLGLIGRVGKNLSGDFPLFLITGIFVEAPYVVISTSVSADLGTHKMVKRNYRALSTVGGIIEGFGAIGASLGTFFAGLVLAKTSWEKIIYLMVVCHFLAILCLGRQAYRDFYGKQKKEAILEYLKLPAFT